ncbi:hypothetical protein RYX36_012511 [Vicia faba]
MKRVEEYEDDVVAGKMQRAFLVCTVSVGLDSLAHHRPPNVFPLMRGPAIGGFQKAAKKKCSPAIQDSFQKTSFHFLCLCYQPEHAKHHLVGF